MELGKMGIEWGEDAISDLKGQTIVKHAVLTAAIWREEDQYASHCPELGVASCGDSPDHALSMLKEAVELYLVNAVQLGIWDDVSGAVESPQRFTAPIEVTLP